MATDGYWHLSQEAVAGFFSIVGSAVALQDVLPRIPGESHRQTLLKSLPRCQDVLIAEMEALTLDDEKQIRTLVEVFHQSVQSGSSVFTPSETGD